MKNFQQAAKCSTYPAAGPASGQDATAALFAGCGCERNGAASYHPRY